MVARVAVLVSGGGTNLQAIIDAKEAGKMPNAELCLVVADKEGAYALTRAEKHGIKHTYIPKGQAFEDNLVALLEAEKIDIIVLAGFLSILSENFVKAYPKRIINIHPSLIPSFCGDGFYGLRVHKAALEKGVKVTGATVHFVNEITDGGEIIAQKAVAVLPGDTPELLQRRVMEEAEWELLPAATQAVSKAWVEKN